MLGVRSWLGWVTPHPCRSRLEPLLLRSPPSPLLIHPWRQWEAVLVLGALPPAGDRGRVQAPAWPGPLLPTLE